MICRKCGTENNDDNQFCLRCGKSLTPPKRGKTAWIIGSIAALVLTAVIVLLFVFLPHAEELNGAWHSEQLNQMLRFHDDGTVVVRTSSGDYEADYLLDRTGKRGVITLNGAAISFAVDGDNLLLTNNGLESYFIRGDMEIVPAMSAMSVASPTPSPVQTATPATDLPEAEHTPEPMSPPESEDTPEPEDATDSDPNWDAIRGAADKVLKPNNDIIGDLVASAIIGEWRTDNTGILIKLKFESTGNFTRVFLMHQSSGTYTYNSTSGNGELLYSDGTSATFSVSEDTLTMNDGTVFRRD